jgi:hypothetical protein
VSMMSGEKKLKLEMIKDVRIVLKNFGIRE